MNIPTTAIEQALAACADPYYDAAVYASFHEDHDGVFFMTREHPIDSAPCYTPHQLLAMLQMRASLPQHTNPLRRIACADLPSALPSSCAASPMPLASPATLAFQWLKCSSGCEPAELSRPHQPTLDC